MDILEKEKLKKMITNGIADKSKLNEKQLIMVEICEKIINSKAKTKYDIQKIIDELWEEFYDIHLLSKFLEYCTKEFKNLIKMDDDSILITEENFNQFNVWFETQNELKPLNEWINRPENKKYIKLIKQIELLTNFRKHYFKN